LQHTSLAETVTSPRWATDDTGAYSSEPGARLDAGFNPRMVEPLGLRSVQQIMRIGVDGSLEAAADPRTNAKASAVY
jgi:hypothetical protein